MVGRISLLYPHGELFAYEKFTYDALGEKVRVRAAGVDHNKPFHEDVLLLFREGVVYQISYKNRTCTKKPLKVTFHPLEIPQNATLQAQVILGSSSGPGQGLLVNNWMGDIPEQKGKYYMTFTEFGCIPLSTLYIIQDGSWIFSSFFNTIIGIDDPQDLIPPDFCDTAKAVDKEPAVTNFFDALKIN